MITNAGTRSQFSTSVRMIWNFMKEQRFYCIDFFIGNCVRLLDHNSVFKSEVTVITESIKFINILGIIDNIRIFIKFRQFIRTVYGQPSVSFLDLVVIKSMPQIFRTSFDRVWYRSLLSKLITFGVYSFHLKHSQIPHNSCCYIWELVWWVSSFSFYFKNFERLPLMYVKPSLLSIIRDRTIRVVFVCWVSANLRGSEKFNAFPLYFS